MRVSHHTNDCKKADGTTCDKCKRNHHRSLHNEKKEDPSQFNLNPNATAFKGKRNPDVENPSVQGRDDTGASDPRNEPGVCPVQKVTVRDSDGNFKTLITCHVGHRLEHSCLRGPQSYWDYLVLKHTLL